VNDTESDITVVAGELHADWSSATTDNNLQGSALREYICSKTGSEDDALVNKVVKLIVRKRAEFIAEAIGLTVAEEFKRLGAGGFGSVFAAKDSTWSWRQEAVALKLLNPILVEVSSPISPTPPGKLSQQPVSTAEQTPNVRLTPQARFRKEHDILSQLSHPGLPRIFHGGEIKRQPFYVMQSGGPSLWDPRGCKLVTSRGMITVARFAADLLEVLVYVHAHQIAHRDLKPSNILGCIDRGTGEPQPMLIDFGIFQDRRQGAGQDTKTGMEPGGGDYWSENPTPESYRKDGRPGDIYNFGRVLGFLLDPEKVRGEVKNWPNPTPTTPPAPAATSNPESAASSIRSQTADPVRDRLTEIAAKCCLPLDQGRYSSAAAVLVDVRALLEPATVQHARNPVSTSRRSRLHLHWWTLAIAASVILIGGILVGYIAAPDRSAEVEIAKARLLMEEAEHAREGENPSDVEEKYCQAEGILAQARSRWPKNRVILELLARDLQALGQECDGQGRIQDAENKYSAAIGLWNDLIRMESTNDYRRGLALAFGCRGDVKLLVDERGNSDERAAESDYDKSLRIREDLAKRSPENGDYRLQFIIAKTNYARLRFYKQPEVSLQLWKELIQLLKDMQQSGTFDAKTKRQAMGLLADSLLDHQNGYLACFTPLTLQAGQPKSPKEEEALNAIKLADELCLKARSASKANEADEPDVVVREIALGYFKSRLGLDELCKKTAIVADIVGTAPLNPYICLTKTISLQSRLDEPTKAFPALLQRLQTHIDSLPKGKRNWARSLFVEIVLDMHHTNAADLKDWKTTADAFAEQLPPNHYFYSKQKDKWNKRASHPSGKH
jgi:serine/threonine protein kinase